jgi:hypothetical protein
MYQLVSANARLKVGDGSWQPTSIGNLALKDLFRDYSYIYATLSNPFLTENVVFDLNVIRDANLNSTLTFSAFLTANGEHTLPTMSIADATIVEKNVGYNDAFKAGYKITHVAPNSPPDTNHTYQDKTWLLMSKPGVNYATFVQRCMVNVNGFFHLIEHDQHGVYVIDGMKSKFMSGLNLIGILGFGEVGALTQIPITSSMLYKQSAGQKFKDNVFVDLGVDVTNKTVIAVIGGYMHLLDQRTMRMIDRSRVMINFGNLPFLERYYESRGFIDLSSLPIDTTLKNDSQVGATNFYSDEVITAYMTLSQSFFVILDAKDVFLKKHVLCKSNLPDLYISHMKPTFPLITGYGKVTNYWSTFEDRQWAINCAKTIKPRYLFNTTEQNGLTSFTNSRIPDDPARFSRAYFLQIGRDIL